MAIQSGARPTNGAECVARASRGERHTSELRSSAVPTSLESLCMAQPGQQGVFWYSSADCSVVLEWSAILRPEEFHAGAAEMHKRCNRELLNASTNLAVYVAVSCRWLSAARRRQNWALFREVFHTNTWIYTKIWTVSRSNESHLQTSFVLAVPQARLRTDAGRTRDYTLC
jgi:hypothetical protein